MKLNLGCGTDVRPGWVNVDRHRAQGVTTIDLSKTPWPWPDASADEILASHVIEHVPDAYEFLDECGRVLKPGGRLTLYFPYWKDPVACHGNLDHKRTVHPHGLTHYVKAGETRDLNQRTRAVFQKLEWRISRRPPYRGPVRWGLWPLARLGVSWAWKPREVEAILTR